VLLLSCAYREQEFITIGYYVSVAYDTPEMQETPPATPQLDKLVRNILHTEPRVTRFSIKWTDDQPDEMPPPQPNADDDYDNEQEAMRIADEQTHAERAPPMNVMHGDNEDSCDIQANTSGDADEQGEQVCASTTLCDVTNVNAKQAVGTDDAFNKSLHTETKNVCQTDVPDQ